MCAIMYPQKEDITDLPFSEREVYDFLEKLGDGYIIFHSVQWVKRSNKWRSMWKEKGGSSRIALNFWVLQICKIIFVKRLTNL